MAQDVADSTYNDWRTGWWRGKEFNKHRIFKPDGSSYCLHKYEEIERKRIKAGLFILERCLYCGIYREVKFVFDNGERKGYVIRSTHYFSSRSTVEAIGDFYKKPPK